MTRQISNVEYLVTSHADAEASAFAVYQYTDGNDADGIATAGGVAVNDNPGFRYG